MNETWDISKLKNWDKNPRAVKKEDFERLKKQIQELGMYKPLLITPDGTVLGGNMRLRAYKELGLKDIWVSIIEPKTEAEMVKYALSDNDRAGYYVEQDLAELIQEYGVEINLEDYKVDLGEAITLLDLLNRIGPDPIEDEPPALAEGEPDSKLGEIYTLGKHRLMCGDATKIEDVEILMNGQKADMVFTDPPYGLNYVGKTDEKLTIQNDENTNIFALSLPNFIKSAKAGASFYVCCPADNNFKDFFLPFEQYCHLAANIIWSKNSMVLGHGDYHYQHEPILYGWGADATHRFYGDRTQTTIWNIDRPAASKIHPTMKPIALITKALLNSSKQDDIVLDLFGGSGSTLIASEQTNRTCYMMELDPKYVDVIRKKYDNFVAKTVD